MKQEGSPEGPPCPVDPETDDLFSDVLARAAVAGVHAQAGSLPSQQWRVWIRPSEAPFCQWLLWNSVVFSDAAFREEAGAVYWPMTVPDADPVARELMYRIPGISAWAEPVNDG